MNNKLFSLGIVQFILIIFCLFFICSQPVYSRTQSPESEDSETDSYDRQTQNLEKETDEHAEKVHDGGSLAVACPERVRTLDPQKAVLVSEKWVIEQIYDGLIEYDPNGQIIPVLAAFLPERLGENEYFVRLKPGIKFSDGTDLDANDVVFTIRRLINPGTQCPTRELFRDVKGVEATSPLTIKFVLGNNCPDFFELLTRLEARPISREAVIRNGDRYGVVTAVGAGPFRLVEWDRENELILERNYTYKMHQPLLHRIIFRFPKQGVNPFRELTRARIELLSDLSPKMAFRLSTNQYFRIEDKAGRRLCQIYLNVERYPFDRSGVRKAISLGIDREEIITKIFHGFATLAGSCIPPWHRYSDPNLVVQGYDPNTAIKILAGEGFTAEFPVSFSLMYTDDEPFDTMATLIRSQLAVIGVQVHLVPLAKKDLFDYVYSRAGRDRSLFQAALEDWEEWRGGGGDEQFTWQLYHSSSPEYKLGTVSYPWEQDLSLAVKECNPRIREELFKRAIREIDQSMVTIYLCYPHKIWGARNWVNGDFCNSLGNLFLDRVWVR
ncbi:MAG: ABC transporter substrate-binding protein [bacterium]